MGKTGVPLVRFTPKTGGCARPIVQTAMRRASDFEGGLPRLGLRFLLK